jgi:hypothetical protein
MCRSLDAGPQHKWRANEKSERVARPERAEPGLPLHRFWFCNPARAAATFAERVPIPGNESVEQSTCITKRKQLPRCANQPSGGEQTRQTSDSIPADKNCAIRSEHVQLPQAIIHPEPGINAGQDLRADGQTSRLVLEIEGLQPGHATLANLALLVVEHPVRRLRDTPRARISVNISN